ncbi:hypothetical protein AURDEDRAFT_153835 [Auricularia subglabra TFB-10046 SS5]|nr:hypothetical protein AURDEDRAFT_153835 [Auricularia subglabra TFB-10046 SS5]
MAGSTAASVVTTTSAQALPEDPLRGQIWAASASAILPVLQAAAACTVAGLSVAMQTDKDALERSNTLPTRPCLILRHNSKAKTVVALVFTTLGRGLTDISEADRYFQHFAVSVGDTPAWPSPNSWTLQTEPRWRTVPQYLSACTLVLPYDSLLGRFGTGSSRRLYDCDERSLLKLERICAERMASYETKSARELSSWAISYEPDGSPVLSPGSRAFPRQNFQGPRSVSRMMPMPVISEHIDRPVATVAADKSRGNRFSILATSDSDESLDDTAPPLSHSPDSSSCESSPSQSSRSLEACAALGVPRGTPDRVNPSPAKAIVHKQDGSPDDVLLSELDLEDDSPVPAVSLVGYGLGVRDAGTTDARGATFHGAKYFGGSGRVARLQLTGLGLQSLHLPYV